MKIMMSLLIGLFTLAAEAQMSGSSACQRLSLPELKIQCFELVNRAQYINNNAVAACDRISGQVETLNCMKAIVNKLYSTSEVQACDSFASAVDTTNCFRRLGQYVSGGSFPQPIPPSYPQPKPDPTPTPSGYSCVVRELGGSVIPGNQFFHQAFQRAQSARRCVIAKIAFEPNSGRIYDRDGRRVAKEMGGLSNREVDQIASQYGLYSCLKMTCDGR